MKKYDIIAFDLDGTLTDPARGLIASYKYAFSKMNITPEPDEALRRFIGPPLYDEWCALYRLSEEEGNRMIGYFREFFSVYGWWDNELYPGVREMLSDLKAAGKTLVLSTSKPEVFAKKILALFEIDSYFDFVGAADLNHTREKKWEVLDYALSSVGAVSGEDRERCIIVGDRIYDAEGAEKCGIDALGVTYGHAVEGELSRAGFIKLCDSCDEVARFLI